jgi:hypothetical protein
MALKIDMIILEMAVDHVRVFVPVLIVSDGVLFGLIICSRAELYSH